MNAIDPCLPPCRIVPNATQLQQGCQNTRSPMRSKPCWDYIHEHRGTVKKSFDYRHIVPIMPNNKNDKSKNDCGAKITRPPAGGANVWLQDLPLILPARVYSPNPKVSNCSNAIVTVHTLQISAGRVHELCIAKNATASP